ncbi:MAG: IS481 family transposase [Rubripirellula sp.]
MSLREEFVSLAQVECCNFSELCRRFGISRRTGYKWRGRAAEGDDDALQDRSRRPEISPKRTAESVEDAVLEIRRKHPTWGGRKLRKRLQALGHTSVPAASTLTQILHRHGCISQEESDKHKPYGSFEREQPNELWQVDFKGEFGLSPKGICYPLTILDDHSRYSLCIHACGNQKGLTVQKQFRHVFDCYGIPRAIYVDNGNPWGTTHVGFRHTWFTTWLMRHDIRAIHGKPYYPQGRGKLERFHRTLKQELLQDRQFVTLSEAQSNFDSWRLMYNTQRPHESLDLEVPASRYRCSDRSFIERLGDYEYSDRFEVRRTSRNGELRFRGQQYRFSKAFRGENVGLTRNALDGIWDVYYCRFQVAQIDERTGEIKRHFHQPAG